MDTFFRAIFGVTYAELQALLDLLDEYREPIAFDCLAMGLRLRDLGTDALTYDDLLTIIRQSPPDSALQRAMNPDHLWGLSELLLAEVADSLQVANWQRGDGKRQNYPRPIPRPGVADSKDTTHFGKDPLPIDEMAEWLGWT